MTLSLKPLYLAITTTLFCGCATTMPPQGTNPFDEPVINRVDVPLTPERSLPALQPPSTDYAGPVIDQISVVPVSQEGISEDQTLSTETSSSSNVSSEILMEAERMGSAGDIESKVALLEQASQLGNGDAYYELAKIYQQGKLVPKDQGIANAYLTTAAGMNHAESTRVLAWNYLLGNGLPIDIDYGKQLMASAAESSVRAKREYGLLLLNRLKPHLNDPASGNAMLEEAFRLGDADAGLALGLIDQPSAQVHPGTPIGAKAEITAEQTKQAGLQGDSSAMFLYATNVLLGKYPSMESDFEAYCWFSLAANHGYSQAATELQSLSGVRHQYDNSTPGRLDQCISDLEAAIQQ